MQSGVWYEVVWKGDIVYYSTVYSRYVVRCIWSSAHTISLPHSPALSVFFIDSRQILWSKRKDEHKSETIKEFKRMQLGAMFTTEWLAVGGNVYHIVQCK